jgi:hypothetical protein
VTRDQSVLKPLHALCQARTACIEVGFRLGIAACAYASRRSSFQLEVVPVWISGDASARASVPISQPLGCAAPLG